MAPDIPGDEDVPLLRLNIQSMNMGRVWGINVRDDLCRFR